MAPFYINGSTGISGVDGSAATPALQGTDTNTGISFGSDVIIASTGGSERLRIDSSGRVGIGKTPDATAFPVVGGLQLAGGANLFSWGNFGGTYLTANAFYNGSNWIYQANNASSVYIAADGNHVWLRASSGTAGNTAALLESARIDTSGRLLVGTSTAQGQSIFQAVGNSSASTDPGDIRVIRGLNISSIGTNVGAELGIIKFGALENSVCAQISAVCDANWSAGDTPGRLVFSTTADGASSPTERLRIRSDGVLVSPVTYAATSATSANVNVDSSGNFTRSTSSAKYKADIESIDDSYSDALLNCRPVWYRSTSNNDNPSWSWWGFIAEEVAEIDPRLVQWKTVEVTYDDNGSAIQTPCDPEPEGVAYDRFVPHLLNLIKRQKEQIEAMEARLSALENA